MAPSPQRNIFIYIYIWMCCKTFQTLSYIFHSLCSSLPGITRQTSALPMHQQLHLPLAQVNRATLSGGAKPVLSLLQGWLLLWGWWPYTPIEPMPKHPRSLMDVQWCGRSRWLQLPTPPAAHSALPASTTHPEARMWDTFRSPSVLNWAISSLHFSLFNTQSSSGSCAALCLSEHWSTNATFVCWTSLVVLWLLIFI